MGNGWHRLTGLKDEAGNTVEDIMRMATASAAMYEDFKEQTTNGANKVRLKAPDNLAADVTVVLPSSSSTLLGQNTSTGELAIPGTATAAAAVSLGEDTDNGVNKVSIQAPAAVTANRVQTLQDADGTVLLSSSTGVLAIPGVAGNPGSIRLSEDTDNGANTYTVTAPSDLTANRTETKPDASIVWPAGAGGNVTPIDAQSVQTITAAKTLGAGGSLVLGAGGISGGFTARDQGVSAGVNNVAHGLARTPSFISVIPVSGHDGAAGVGTQAGRITSVTADGTNVTFTADVAGFRVDVIAF